MNLVHVAIIVSLCCTRLVMTPVAKSDEQGCFTRALWIGDIEQRIKTQPLFQQLSQTADRHFNPRRVVVCTLQLLKDGTITHLHMSPQSTSGSATLDQQILNIIQGSFPFEKPGTTRTDDVLLTVRFFNTKGLDVAVNTSQKQRTSSRYGDYKILDNIIEAGKDGPVEEQF